MIAQTNVQLITQLIGSDMPEPVLLRVDAAYRFLIPLFADRFRCDGRPFLAHLCGTCGLVAEVTDDADTIVASLLHAIFAQGRLARSGGPTRANRARVVAIAGPGPVALILAYQQLSWRPQTVHALARSTEPIDSRSRSVLLIRLANEAEEHADGASAFGAKSRYAGEPGLLDAIDAIDRRLGTTGLAQRLRDGVAAGGHLAVPPAIRRSTAASFDATSHRLADIIGRVRRATLGRSRG